MNNTGALAKAGIHSAAAIMGFMAPVPGTKALHRTNEFESIASYSGCGSVSDIQDNYTSEFQEEISMIASAEIMH